MTRSLRGSIVPLVLCAVGLACWGALRAEESGDAICRLWLHEEQVERDDVALELELAGTRLAAAEEIYGLLVKLWENDAVERMIYLLGQHERDVALLRKQRVEYRLQRQDALIEQYRRLCGSLSSGSLPDGERRAADRAYERYHAADCEVQGTSAAIAEVDLAYRREVEASILDLRRNDVATRQDVIRAERDVRMAAQRVDEGKRRHAACRTAAGRSAPAGSP